MLMKIEWEKSLIPLMLVYKLCLSSNFSYSAPFKEFLILFNSSFSLWLDPPGCPFSPNLLLTICFYFYNSYIYFSILSLLDDITSIWCCRILISLLIFDWIVSIPILFFIFSYIFSDILSICSDILYVLSFRFLVMFWQFYIFFIFYSCSINSFNLFNFPS